MAWKTVMEEDGVVTLPGEVLVRNRYQPGTIFEIVVVTDGLLLRPLETALYATET